MSSARFAIVALVLSLPPVAACSKSDDGSKPSSVPPLGSNAAPPAPSAAAPPPAAAPPAAPAAEAPAPPAGPGGSITGKVELTKAIAKATPKGTLFITARRISDNPNVRGSLIAVKKLPATTFPVEFSMSAADMPFQGATFDGELTLTARIDQDGDPLSRQKGDVHGTLPKVQVGSKDVRLTIDQVQKEAESLTSPGGGAPGPGPGPGPMMGGSRLPPGHP
jgi:hypothetical protein